MIVAHSLAIVYQVPDNEKHFVQFNLREICSYSGGLSAFELNTIFDLHKNSGMLNKNDIEIVQDTVDTGSRHAARLREVCSAEIDEITGNK